MNKLISLFIVFALLISIPVPCVFAEAASDAGTDSFELIYALGIDEGINKANSEIITRAEFTAMAVRALNMDALASPDGSFADVAAEAPFASEIYMAKNLRMTNGTSEGIFSPDAEVTGNVALKMLLTAMGYESIAQARGGYPTGYIALDSTLDLMQGVSSSQALTVYDAKTIITNALKADMAVFSGIENEQLVTSTSGGRTLLSERFGFEAVSGIADTAGYITYDAQVTSEDALLIGGMNLTSRIDASPYFGMSITAYHKDGEVYAIETNDTNKIVTVDSRDVAGFADNTLTVYNSDKEYRYRTDRALTFVKNGRVINYTSDSFTFDHGTLRLIDNNGDNAYDIVIAQCVEYYVVSGINQVSYTIYDNNSSIGPICFDGRGSYEVTRLLDADGNTADVTALSENEVLQVMRSDDGKICIVRSGGSQTLSGKVEEITASGYVINGTEYIPNSYFKSRGIVVNAGSEYTFLLASDMTLTTTTGNGSDGIVYGYLVDAAEETGLSANTLVKVLTSSGDIKVFTLADRITLEGESGVLRSDSKIDAVLYNGEYPKYQLLRYRTDKNGCINLIDTADGGIDSVWDVVSPYSGDDTLTQYASKVTVDFRGGSDFGAPLFSFTNGVIFAVPNELLTKADKDYDESLFTVKNSADLYNNTDYDCDIFDFDSYYYPAAVVIYTEISDGSTRVRSEQNSHIVYEVADVLDEDGNLTKAIRTFSKGTYYTHLIAPEKLDGFSAASPSLIPESGDIIRFELDKNNHIVGINIDAEYNSTTKKPEVKYTSGGVSGYISYISGTVKTIGNGQITLKVQTGDYTPGTLINNVAPVPLNNASYTIYNTKTGEAETGVITDVMPASAVGMANASKVLCRISYYAAVEVFIYTE